MADQPVTSGLVREVSRDELEAREAFLLNLLGVFRNYTEHEVESELNEIRFLLGKKAGDVSSQDSGE